MTLTTACNGGNNNNSGDRHQNCGHRPLHHPIIVVGTQEQWWLHQQRQR